MTLTSVFVRTRFAACLMSLTVGVGLGCGEDLKLNDGSRVSPGTYVGFAEVQAARESGDVCKLEVQIDAAEPQSVTGELKCTTEENGGLIRIITVHSVFGEIVSSGFAEGLLSPDSFVPIPWSASIAEDHMEFVWSRGLSDVEVGRYFDAGAVSAMRNRPGRCESGGFDLCLGRVPLPTAAAGAVIEGRCPQPCSGTFVATCDGEAWTVDATDCSADDCAATTVAVCGGEIDIDAIPNGELVELSDVCADGCLEYNPSGQGIDYAVWCSNGVVGLQEVGCFEPAFGDCDGVMLPVCGGEIDVPDMPSGESIDYAWPCNPGCFDDVPDVTDPINYRVACNDGVITMTKEQCYE